MPNALTLAGSTYGSGLSYTSTSALSFSFWWKTSSSGDSYFIGDSDASSDFRAGSGVLSFSDETAGAARYWNLGAFNDNTWRMITLTISSDRATVKAYINGTLATQTQAGVVGGNFVITRIFATNGNSNASFDDFKIYTKELSQAEVTALYNGGSPAEVSDMTNMYAYYKLNASSGTSAVDSSGNGRTVTLVGGSPVWATGIVTAGVNPLVDVELLKIANNSTISSYGDYTHGYYLGTYGTSNIYEGLTHRFNILGSAKLTLNSTALTSTVPYYAPNGSAAAPGVAGSSDTNTGIYWSGADDLLFTTNGVARMSFNNIGTAGFIPNGTQTLNISSTGIGIGGLYSGYSGQFNVQNTSGATTKITSVIKAIASQTGDLTQWQNSAGTALIKFSAAGVATFTGGVVLGGGTQDYTWGKRSSIILTLQSQTSGATSQIEYYSKDGDGTDDVGFAVFAKGIPSDITNFEQFRFFYNNGISSYVVGTNKGGTGAYRDIRIGNGLTPTDLVIKATTGYVGVGTSSPTAMLHVVAPALTNAGRFQVDASTTTWSSTYTGFEMVNANATTNNHSLFAFSDNTGGAGSAGIGAKYTDRSNHYADLYLFTKSTDGYQQRVYLTADGKLGIGNTSPAYTLDVTGEGHFTGILTLDDDLDMSAGGNYINFASSYISDGTLTGNWYLDTGTLGIGVAPDSMYSLYAAGDIYTLGNFLSTGYADVSVGYKVGGVAGYTGDLNDSSSTKIADVVGGIITAVYY